MSSSQPDKSSATHQDTEYSTFATEHPCIVKFEEVSAAAFKIRGAIEQTPCTRSHLSSLTGVNIYLKKEYMQFTGCFKERGARFALLMLTEEQKAAGVISASAGNHALALAYHAQILQIPATVVMATVTPLMKLELCRQFGANVIIHGTDYFEATRYAIQLSKDKNITFINGYDNPHIIAGQGTMGLEIVQQLPDVDAVLVPVGGGGLIAGVVIAVKSLFPNVKVYGIESERCACFQAALAAGKPVYTELQPTLADALNVPLMGMNAFATAASLVDRVIVVR